MVGFGSLASLFSVSGGSKMPVEYFKSTRSGPEEIPPSIYFGGCAFGAAFCKLLQL